MARTKNTKKTENTIKKEIVANNKKTTLAKVKDIDASTSENNEDVINQNKGEDTETIGNANIRVDGEDKAETKNDTSDNTMETETTVLKEVIKETNESSEDTDIKHDEKPKVSTKRYMKDVYGYNWMGQCTDW